MPGMTGNIHEMLDDRLFRSNLAEVSNKDDAPLAEVLGLILRERIRHGRAGAQLIIERQAVVSDSIAEVIGRVQTRDKLDEFLIVRGGHHDMGRGAAVSRGRVVAGSHPS